MAAWFRKGLSPHHTGIAMVGAKPGDRVLVVGALDPDFAAEIALVTGLNGSTTVADADASARTRVEASAARAGALVEFLAAPSAALSVPDASQDIVVIMASAFADAPELMLDEPLRALRQGGRLVVVDGVRASGLFRARGSPRRSKDQVLGMLERSGAFARRQLADVNGVAYYEARK
jgi:ubiquinone/menaquinone biosynthesis C-methylase UbiE